MLQLTDVDAFYGNVPALRGVSLTAHEGAITTLLGPNGSGKTTTLRTISGLLATRGGSIHFEGEAIGGLDAAAIVRRGIVQVPEGRLVFPDMSVLENLRMGAFTRRSKPEIKAGLDRVYALFPILHTRRSKPAGALSGGEQQMLAIGRGLMAQPRMLLLDEPSLGLSPLLVQTIGQIIREICAQGTSILLVEQSALMTLDLGGAGYVLENGRIALAGDVRELLRDDSVRRTYMGVGDRSGGTDER